MNAEERRRAQVVAAATAAIDEDGVGVGTAQIAERAGIPRPHVYRYVESREHLDALVARAAATQLLEHVRPAFAQAGTGREIIQGILTATVEWAADHPNLYRFMAQRPQTPGEHRARFGRTRFLDTVANSISGYLSVTDIQVAVPEGILAGLIGMADGTIVWWLDHQDESRDAMVRRLTRQIEAVIRDALAHVGLSVPEDLRLEPPS
jgi:AcrR family transcriptional regulator